ncbi:YhcN/YlaJ family sporulation lipoprotein [Priestia abyssalis]|uniref:YhcN/YlaJ family sporulation lipoprotein n=1 Tax=Priestia abyssalis TaxID=1221450 RepID=UPI000995C1F9|nr:YhcN/YlaJ family sporulation lipoprotein [Priestia abyssalis]
MLNKVNAAILSFACAASLTACNTNEEAGMQRYNDSTRPVGYYSNERDMRMVDRAERNGNAILMNDNDGPVTEIMDRTTRDDGIRNGETLNVRNGITRINNMSRPTQPYSEQTEGFFYSNARVGGENDRNYHGHLNSTNAPAKTSYYEGKDGDFLQDIVNRVEKVKGVKDARVLKDGNRMLVAVDANAADPALLENEIRQQLSDVDRTYKLQVKVDDGIYNSARNIDNDLRDGGADGLIRTNINSLFETIDEKVNRSTR